MQATTRKIDKLGRIVLPMEYRRKLHLKECAEVVVSMSDGCITVRGTMRICKLCGAQNSIDSNFSICEECLEKIKSTLME